MREIKFRQALFSRDGKFTHWHYWGFISSGQFVGVELGISNHEQALKNSYQYTGLKDKNGKEIYEGDIVRIKQYNYDSEWRLCTLTIVSPITFTSDCQFFPTKLVNNRLWEPDTEVIGNIYENPELLEALDEQDR